MGKLALVRPSPEYAEEIRAYREESLAAESHIHGSCNLAHFENPLEWIERSIMFQNRETLPNPQWVETDQYLLVREGERRVLGMINPRRYLDGNAYLTEYGGHIGYSVRPSERRKGYAKAMLTLCLDKCRELGLEKVLLTCDARNEGSRRTIRSCGGVYERTTHSEGENIDLERYWIALRDA